MIKVFSSEQIRKWDEFTIKNEPITSFDLMERASNAFVEQFLIQFPEKRRIRIFCGIGNNGGDGLAIGRILKEKGWEVLKYIVGNPKDGSEDFKKNLDQSDLYAVLKKKEEFPELLGDDIVIDGLFGTGLSRPLDGLNKLVVEYINASKAYKVSIDIASGLFVDKPLDPGQVAIMPATTISFQLPKLPFFLPEYYQYVGDWKLVDIRLHPDYLRHESSGFFYLQHSDMKGLIPRRQKFTHKKEVGSLSVVAGSKGKMGAAVLCARAALVAGVGLLNVYSPACGSTILQIAVPEAMVFEDPEEAWISTIPKVSETVIIGPGLATESETLRAFEDFLRKTEHPIVLDADALNLLAKKKSLLRQLPKNSILTPHPGEFRRLVGPWKNDFEKLEKLGVLCKKFQINVVLKGAYSVVCDARGDMYFNSSGNPALATAGSGDVLAGVAGSFLAQGLEPTVALQIAVFVHGMAGDLAVEEEQTHSIIASQIIKFLPKAVKECL